MKLKDHLHKFLAFRYKLPAPLHAIPHRIGEPRTFPFVLETRLPDPETGGDEIIAIDPEAVQPCVTIQNAESTIWSFSPGDLIVITSPPPHCKSKLSATISELDEKEGRIYLDLDHREFLEADIHSRATSQNGDRIYRQDSISHVIGFPTAAAQPMTENEQDRIRESMGKTFRLFTPNPHIDREDGESARNILAYCAPLTDEPRHIIIEDRGDYSDAPAHGWMIPSMSDYSIAFGHRWQHWLDLFDQRDDSDIPFIKFVEPHDHGIGMLLNSLSYINPDWEKGPKEKIETLRWFFKWMLWSLGHEAYPERPEYGPDFDNRAHSNLVQVFNFAPLYLWPSDYWGRLIEVVLGLSVTSMEEQRLAVDQIFAEVPEDADPIYQTFFDVEPGCGKRMLWASNHSYHYIAISKAIQPAGSDLYLAALWLNAMMYAPWLIHPPTDIGEEDCVLTSSALMTEAQSAVPGYARRAFPIEQDELQHFRPLAYKVTILDDDEVETPEPEKDPPPEPKFMFPELQFQPEPNYSFDINWNQQEEPAFQFDIQFAEEEAPAFEIDEFAFGTVDEFVEEAVQQEPFQLPQAQEQPFELKLKRKEVPLNLRRQETDDRELELVEIDDQEAIDVNYLVVDADDDP